MGVARLPGSAGLRGRCPAAMRFGEGRFRIGRIMLEADRLQVK
jgi:hypothetical protein